MGLEFPRGKIAVLPASSSAPPFLRHTQKRRISEGSMWIVKLALRRPYTFVVVSMLIALLGIGSAIETPKDIFPYINIPVVTIVWTYTGLTPTEMEGRVVTVCERALTTTVNDMEHTESESYQGVAIIKVFFQPKVNVDLALAQVTSIVQTILRVL